VKIAMSLELLFTLANVFVLPFWILMLLVPNWDVTRKVMASYWFFLPLAGLYLYLLTGELNAESAAALANPTLADIARFFGEEGAAATGWVHFVVMDLFVGRWVYWEGQRTGRFVRHSVALCLFAGPLGVLSHIITTWATEQFFSPSEGETPATEA
jgi:hypothetical protein